jgi:hypothetical protein
MIFFALALQMQNQPDATNTSFVMFGCILFFVCLAIYIFMPPTDIVSSEAKTRLSFLLERKEMVYENLRDLNFEYKAGKLSDEDFQGMRTSMEQEAAAVLSEIDLIENSNRRSPVRA